MNHATNLRKLLKKGIVVLPGSFNAISAMAIKNAGFKACYISGAGLTNSLAGKPDIGILSREEVVQHAKYIVDAVKIPCIGDGDTGFGGPEQTAKTVIAFEKIGLAGFHIEDQRWPKRCGHLPGKEIITKGLMVKKIKASVKARKKDFLIIARTDARGVKGFEESVDRANAYLDAGADMIFPEALQSKQEFGRFAKEVDGMLLANMTEFGKTPYISVGEFKKMGYNAVIFPMTLFRMAMKPMDEALRVLKKEGSQKRLLSKMQTRKELYQLINYKY